ncbi:MAG: NPCBM/NEW2 domain-containing protein [Rhodoglobus sp.]|nr:NPCBM/NEW2 domain-containing protein [Rhodoglobus sp.]
MSHTRKARSLIGLVAAFAVAGAILVPPPASPASAATPDFTPQAFVDGAGEIPCLDASAAEFAALGCRATIVREFEVPSEIVPALISSGRDRNCNPAPVNPSSKNSSVQAAVGISASQSTTSSTNGGRWTAHGTTVTVAPSYMGTSAGGVSYHYMNTEVSGWSRDLTNALGTTFTVSESRDAKILPYHWMFWTFKPKYRQIEVLWTWSEPAISVDRPSFRASGIQTARFPVFRDGIPVDSDGDGKVAVSTDVILGDWVDVQVPMTPAEIDACAAGGLKEPSFRQPTLLAPSGTAELNRMPFLYTVAPPTAPVLRDRAGTGATLQDARLVVGNSWTGGPVYDAPVNGSLQLMGGSEAGFWTAGNCSTFTARVGYGTNLLLAKDGYARDTLEVWSGKLENGTVRPDRLISQTLVPAAPDAPSVSGREHFQADVNVDVAGAEVVILKVVTGEGYRDPLSHRAPGVLLAEPRLACGSSAGAAAFQQSVYVDPIRTVTVDLAGTPAEVAADPQAFMQPTDVNYGWDCANDPRNPAGVMPRTTVGLACGGGPLTIRGQVYDSGIGFHSGDNIRSGSPAPASVVWAKTPATCTALSFGVGFDDHPGFPRATHKVTVYSQLHDPTDGSLNPWSASREMIGSPLHLNGDGASGVQWFHFESLGVGSKRIEIEVATDSNGNGHVDIVNPTLTCQFQGPTTSSSTPVQPSGESVGVYEVSTMEWARESNFHGPAERNSSNGETASGDGRPVSSANGGPIMSIGGFSGWSSGIGMVPSQWGQESMIDITTAGRCERLTAWVGIDDYAGRNGSASFKVYADGQLVSESPVKRGGDRPSLITADVSGALVVTIAANPQDGGNAWDHANWAEPKLYCGAPPHKADTLKVANESWAYEWNGWGPAERNSSLGESAARDGRPMSIGGYAGWTSGIGVAPGNGVNESATITINTSGKCEYFTAWVGVDDEVGWRGSVQFAVMVDGVYKHGVEHHVSHVKRGGQQPEFMKVDISGAQSIQLMVGKADHGNAADHANWANPTLYCG